jgi:hypothetical protein
MHVRVALLVLAFVASARLAMAAEDRSVKSPEALKAILDQAMPDLLKGNAPDAFRKIASDEIVDELAHKLPLQYKPHQTKFGSPLDWKYVGMRKRGDTFRQFVYVCRCDYGIIVWRITATEDKGRWLLMGATFDSNYIAILAQAAAGAESNDRDYARPADDVADALAHGRGNAIDLVKANLLAPESKSNPGELRHSIDRVMELIVLGGGIVKSELVQSKNVAGVVAERCYLVRYERSLLKFTILLYRPGKEWKLLGFDYRRVGNVDDMFDTALLEPATPAAASEPKQTMIGSREPKTEDGQKK